MNAKTDYGKTPLMWAAEGGMKRDEFANGEVFTSLITAGADVNAKDNQGSTPLMWVADKVGNVDWHYIMKLLLDAGADPDARDNMGYTVLDHERDAGISYMRQYSHPQ